VGVIVVLMAVAGCICIVVGTGILLGAGAATIIAGVTLIVGALVANNVL
jgi:hypothetical protein